MDLLRQMGQDQALVVGIQHIQGAPAVEDQSAAPGQGLQEQVDLGIVPQRLEVAHPLHRVFDGLFVEYFPVIQGDVQAESVLRQASENLQLDLTHQAHMDLAPLIVELQLGVLLLQLPQLLQGRYGVTVGRQVDPVGHDALQHSLGGLGNIPQGLTGVGAGETRHRSQLSGL